jgi:hypothetical protein
MEQLLIHAETLPGLLAALTVVSTLRLLSHVSGYLWGLRQRKDRKIERALETLTTALRQNNGRLKTLELALTTAVRVRVDVRRLRAAVRILAGDDWDDVWQQVLRDDDDEGEDAA